MQVSCSIVGVHWGSVRANMLARAIADYIKTGRPYLPIVLAVADSRFIPAPFEARQSKVSDQDRRSLLLWAAKIWPEWSIPVVNLLPVFQYLEAFPLQDQQKTLEILRTHYGLQ